MKHVWRNVSLVLCSTLLAWFVLAVPAAGQGMERARNGFYIGGFYASLGLGGGFNGTDVLTDAEETIIIPKLQTASGFGIVFGRRTGDLGIDITFQQTKHDAFWQGFVERSTNNVIELNVKYFMMRRSMVQPFLLLGLGGDWFTVPNGSASDTDVGDASYRGFTFTPGCGLAFYVVPRVSLSVSAGYRFMLLGMAKGVAGTFKNIEDTTIGSGLNFTAGMTVTF